MSRPSRPRTRPSAHRARHFAPTMMVGATAGIPPFYFAKQSSGMVAEGRSPSRPVQWPPSRWPRNAEHSGCSAFRGRDDGGRFTSAEGVARGRPLKKGFFITFEGPEGSGKSSQSRYLESMLRRRGYDVRLTCDPGSTEIGRRLRHILLHAKIENVNPLMEALLFIGGRAQLVQELIAPGLAKGRIVICDRFHDATLAYQGFGGKLDVSLLDRIGRCAIKNIMPQLTILLDLPTDEGFGRLRRARDRMERKHSAFHLRVRNGYLRLARREPRRFFVVDAGQKSKAIRCQVFAHVMERLAD